MALPPKSDQIEISVFGPGYGECIVVHVGDGIWFIVDCCIEKTISAPKPIEYLKSIGFDPAQAVKLVAATHWHDDHVAGLSKTLNDCGSAIFSCPVALSSKEFLKLCELYREAPVCNRPGTEEMRKSLSIAAHRSKEVGKPMLKFAKADSMILNMPDKGVSVYGLSPSDEMVRRCNEYMVREYVKATDNSNSLLRILSSSPNDTASALKLTIRGRSILLGSDVEEQNDPLVGWSAILIAHNNDEVYTTFKVAHHGSKNGHHDQVWAEMLSTNPLSLITPFRNGRHRLPTDVDRARILSLTNQAYISSHPERLIKPNVKRVGKIESLIEKATKQRQLAIGPVGHIRWRASLADPSDAGVVELFDGALPLADVA